MSLRSHLGRARGLGSAKDGVEHWWMQRLTAIALVPLSIWFIAGVIGMVGAGYSEFQDWLSGPFNASMMILTLVAGFWHGCLGLQVVIEDYVHNEPVKVVSLIAIKLISILLGTASVLSVLIVATGA